MSKHNYSQYSNKKKPNTNNNNKTSSNDNAMTVSNTISSIEPTVVHNNVAEVKMEVKPAVPSIELVKETVDAVSIPETVDGVVVNCAKLNVRAEPSMDAEVVCVLDAMSEIKVDVAKSTPDWFKISTAIGIEGYCMRKFVDAHL